MSGSCRGLWRLVFVLAMWQSVAFPCAGAQPKAKLPAIARKDRPEFAAVRLAIRDLMETFGEKYPRGPEYLAELARLEEASRAGDVSAAQRLGDLRQRALLENPLLDFDRLILLKRKRGQLGLPTNHQCNSCLNQAGYDNEIAILSPPRPGGQMKTLFRPEGGMYVGEIDLHFDADRLLFTMPNGRTWQIHEIGIDGSGRRQVSREVPDVDNFDACYLPDGRIVFASTAAFTGVPCWHGKERACCLYLMNPDGTGMRQLCFDQDHDLHPSVLANGQVIFSRWDYTGPMHIYLRPLMVMNPDGTLQRAVYGSNSYFPNALYYPRAIPGEPTKVAAILSGYHGPNRMGGLVVLDLAKGWREADGIVHQITRRGKPTVPEIRDNLVENWWPKFLHPYPLSGKYFLAAAQIDRASPWGIYLVDVFDNVLPLALDPKYDCFEPLPVRPVPHPAVIPDRVDLARSDAAVYLHDIYRGPGLQGVPRGAVKRLRIVAYHFGFPGMAGPDKIGRSGPWEVMRILGTVPVYPDGSAAFRIPAGTPISVQPLDSEGQALALMRSWYTAMPGEEASCVGCHEQPRDTPAARMDLAALRGPVEIEPWRGPPRGFDFEREVQPVLDKYCVCCHNGQPATDRRPIPDLRSARFAARYVGLPMSQLGASRLEPELRMLKERFAPHQPENRLIGDRCTRYTPAYEALIPLIRRVNIEDSVQLQIPCEYHASTSELMQMLRKGHHQVQLDPEAWDRLITWIDLNGPCHGTWGEVAPIPRGADRRRWELAQMYGGPRHNPEQEHQLPPADLGPPVEAPPPVLPSPHPSRSPQSRSPRKQEAQRRQRAGGAWQQTLPLGGGVTLQLVRIPAGTFLMGSQDGDSDESPPHVVAIPRDFWISACEITNAQFRCFDPQHCSGYFTKRSLSADGPGISMDEPQQPVVRVSWQRAMDFCAWLSARSGLRCTLPSEVEWEYACRAGGSADFNYGDPDADFSRHANMADAALQRLYTVTGGVVILQDIASDTRFDDRGIATVEVGSYEPNAWGLYDMHGNAAEWTRSVFCPYPYRERSAEPAAISADDRMAVRGGSYSDRPRRCRAAFRISYPAWQRVHNVGFRVVAEAAPMGDP